MVEANGDGNNIGGGRVFHNETGCGGDVASSVSPNAADFFGGQRSTEYADIVDTSVENTIRIVVASNANHACRGGEVESGENGGFPVMVGGCHLGNGIETSRDVRPFAYKYPLGGILSVLSCPCTQPAITNKETPIPTVHCVFRTENGFFGVHSPVHRIGIDPSGKGESGAGGGILIGVKGDRNVIPVDVDGFSEFPRNASDVG